MRASHRLFPSDTPTTRDAFTFLLDVLDVAQISRNGMCESRRHLLGDDDAAS